MRKYSVILGNLGNTKDRFCGSYKTPVATKLADGRHLISEWHEVAFKVLKRRWQ